MEKIKFTVKVAALIMAVPLLMFAEIKHADKEQKRIPVDSKNDIAEKQQVITYENNRSCSSVINCTLSCSN